MRAATCARNAYPSASSWPRYNAPSMASGLSYCAATSWPNYRALHDHSRVLGLVGAIAQSRADLPQTTQVERRATNGSTTHAPTHAYISTPISTPTRSRHESTIRPTSTIGTQLTTSVCTTKPTRLTRGVWDSLFLPNGSARSVRSSLTIAGVANWWANKTHKPIS